jgi:membrane protease YdiL (CAAX protease family)
MEKPANTSAALKTWGLSIAVIAGIGACVLILGKPGWVPVIMLLGAVCGAYLGIERKRSENWQKATTLSLLEGLLVSTIVLAILFVGLMGLRQVGWLQFEMKMPVGLMHLLLVEVFAIAIPEELFFRGTVQEGFDKAWGTRWKLFGIEFGWGLFLASALFAIGHIFYQGPRGLLTALPGLGFGLLYEKRQSVAGPVVFHVACNLFIRTIPFLG